MYTEERKANRLIHESSPYLQQHAYNPVDWFPWGDEAFELAQTQDKPVLLSIGYSSCHWCHVMEKQSFENPEIAAVMNEHFINIKVDREERPDIDQIYMEAVQIMGLQGGWPLNVFLTPDKKPFFGGTYFYPQKWQHLLKQIASAYQNQQEQLNASAERFRQALTISETEKYELSPQEISCSEQQLDELFVKLSRQFDKVNGGLSKAPKFPMPSVYSFMLRYHDATGSPLALRHTERTLRKMAYGGIYDHVGGGFSRYSVDSQWLVPHFEKMLYDNAQLLSLYADAYALTKNKTYKRVVDETIEFLKREMYSPEGGFYAALDADSDGEEGLFYTWTYQELQEVIPDKEFALFCQYFQVKPEGNWENNRNILHRKQKNTEFSQQQQLDNTEFEHMLANWRHLLLEKREMRKRPGLDDKIVCGWNGLMLKGLCDAYAATGRPEYLMLAKQNARFIADKLCSEQGHLWHTYKNGQGRIKGFMDDYAAVIQGFTALYQVSFDNRWIEQATALTDYTLQHFLDKEDGLFFYSEESDELIARKKEVFDNVIPSSNALMAHNLYNLSLIMDREAYAETSKGMMQKMVNTLQQDIQYATCWGSLYTMYLKPTVQVAIVGDMLMTFSQGIHQEYIPNKVVVGTPSEGTLPLLVNRKAQEGKTAIYICKEQTCLPPVYSLYEAFRDIKE